MHGDLLADDEAIGDELADGLAGVGVGDLGGFVGVEPDLAFAAAGHGGGEAFLGTQVHTSGGWRKCQLDDEIMSRGGDADE